MSVQVVQSDDLVQDIVVQPSKRSSKDVFEAEVFKRIEDHCELKFKLWKDLQHNKRGRRMTSMADMQKDLDRERELRRSLDADALRMSQRITKGRIDRYLAKRSAELRRSIMQ